MPTGVNNQKIAKLYHDGKFGDLLNLLGYDIRDLVADFSNGVSGKTLCAKFGIRSYVTIWNLMKSLGVHADRVGNNGTQLTTAAKQLLGDPIALAAAYQSKSAVQIAAELGVDNKTVYSYLKKHGIKTRSSRDGLRRFHSRTKPGLILLQDKSWLAEQYLTKNAATIAAHVGLSQPTVLSYLHRHNLAVRATGTHQIKSGDPQAVLAVLRDRGQLASLYSDNSSVAIAKALGCTPRLVQIYLKKHDIKTRRAIDYCDIRQPSAPQLEFSRLLDIAKIRHHSCWIYDGNYRGKDRAFEVDEYLPDLKCFVEIQGEHWHGLDSRHWKYPRVRAKIWTDYIKWQCLTRDYPDHRVVYVSEHAINLDKILGRPTTKCDYDYKKLRLVTNSVDAQSFIINNHYLRSTRPGVVYHITDDTSVLAACVVSRPSRQTIKLSNGGSAGEISRLVARQGVAANLISFLLSRVVKAERNRGLVDGLVTFADPTPVRKGEHSGTVYKSANFRRVGFTQPSYFYIDDGQKPIHKKTVFNRARKARLTEAEFAAANGLHKLPEWPKHKFEYIF